MNWFEKCAVIIPCFNEEAHLGPLVQAIHKQIGTVLVVDDASTDSTAEIATRAGATVIRLSSRSGKGNALNAGLAQAEKLGFQWCLLMDGDGQHEPASIPRFLRAAEETKSQLIIGNRMGQTASMPAMRRWVNLWMSRRLSRLAGCELPDTQCGFRLIELQAWARLDLNCDHFEVESEMLIKAIQAGLQVEFVPIQSIYRGETSKINPWRDTIRWFRWWFHSTRIHSRIRRLRPRSVLAEDAV